MVPGCWQAQFDDLRLFQGICWYQRKLTVPADWRGRAVRLHFGAVGYYCEVWVNGHCAGSHEGGYTPFAFEVSEFLGFGGVDNVLTVRVIDPTDDKELFPQFPFSEIPHGKQSWYGPNGGIWQDVALEATSWLRIEAVRVTPDIDRALAAIEVEIGSLSRGGSVAGCSMAIEVESPSGEQFRRVMDASDLNTGIYKTEISFGNPELWTLSEPRLYKIRASLADKNGEVIDSFTDRFGMRKFWAEEGRFYLNGEPVYLIGALDQDYYAGGIVRPPRGEEESVWRGQFQKAKEMGLNLLRCHIKVADPRYLELADEMGLLLWVEIPNWKILTAATRERARQTLVESVLRDWNHPSVVIRTIVNENWGTDLVNNPDHRRWLVEMYHFAKKLDPSRLVVDNSPCFHTQGSNFHVQSDIDDFHIYRSIPDHYREWEELAKEFARRPAWTYSPHGDGVRSGREPLVISEFGNWGLPNPATLKVPANGGGGPADPWWFATGDGWADGVVKPEGIERRFHEWGLEKVFGSLSNLAVATQWHQFEALKYEIEQMRRWPSINGYVITEFTDVHWEANGLLDLNRREKAFHSRLKEINNQDLLIPVPEAASIWAGEELHFRVLASHWSGRSWDDPVLSWVVPELGLVGSSELNKVEGGIPRLEVTELATVGIRIPPVEHATRATVRLKLANRDGLVLAEGSFVFAAVPERLKKNVRESARIIPIDHRPTAETLALVASGQPAVIIVENLAEVAPGFANLKPLRIEARRGTIWSGDWVSNFNWIQPGIVGGNYRAPGGLLGAEYRDLIPDFLITGVEVPFSDDLLAGMFVGWLRKVAGLAVAVRIGKGKAILTTLKLASGMRQSASAPLASAILTGFAALLQSEEFQPGLKLEVGSGFANQAASGQ